MPKTMTELNMQLREEEREKVLRWLSTQQNIVGNEVRVDVSQWNVGRIGTLVCEVKGWEFPQETAQKETNHQ